MSEPASSQLKNKHHYHLSETSEQFDGTTATQKEGALTFDVKLARLWDAETVGPQVGARRDEVKALLVVLGWRGETPAIFY